MHNKSTSKRKLNVQTASAPQWCEWNQKGTNQWCEWSQSPDATEGCAIYISMYNYSSSKPRNQLLSHGSEKEKGQQILQGVNSLDFCSSYSDSQAASCTKKTQNKRKKEFVTIFGWGSSTVSSKHFERGQVA